MFEFKVERELTCKVSGSGRLYARKGAMIAYKGNFKFEKMLLGPDNGKGVMGALLGYVSRSVTGENIPIMTIEGSGDIYLAHNAYHVEVYDIDPGDTLSVESENLLAFSEGIEYRVRFIGVGVLSQKGLATTALRNISNSTQYVIVLTDGNPIMLEGPCVVDPDAIVAWTGQDPSVITDVSWKSFIGQTSGESYQFSFNAPGQSVLIQPSERLSGLKVGID